MVAICQPSVSALAAAAIMSEDDHPARPSSMTLMAGPIDTAHLADQGQRIRDHAPLELVRAQHDLLCADAMRRRAAPRLSGIRAAAGFVSMNLQRHVKAHIDLRSHLAKGEKEQAETIKTFYDEYFAVMDLLRRLLHRDRARRVSGTPAAARQADVSRPVRESEGDPPHGTAHGRRREGRHLLDRADGRSAGPLHRRARLPQDPPHAGRCRPLRRVQRPKWNNEIYPLLRDFIHVNS